MVQQMAHTVAMSRARLRRLPWPHMVESAIAVMVWFRAFVSTLQAPPLPDDAIEQLRLERMRARLSHDDLRRWTGRIR